MKHQGARDAEKASRAPSLVPQNTSRGIGVRYKSLIGAWW